MDRVPRWSPDGELIAYFSTGGGQIQAWTVRADGSDTRQMTVGEGAGIVVWSPDGATVAANGLVTVSGSGAKAPLLLDPDHPQEWRELPEPEPSLRPFIVNSWSPDGQRLGGMIGYSDQGVVTLSIASVRTVDVIRAVAGVAARQPPPTLRLGWLGIPRGGQRDPRGARGFHREARCAWTTTAHSRRQTGRLPASHHGSRHLAPGVELSSPPIASSHPP